MKNITSRSLEAVKRESNTLREKGITLVALVVTIIILLILSGIAIATLGGENGLFSKVKQGKEKYSIAQSKEKIELEIANLQIEKQGKGEELKKEDLPEMNSDEIDVRDTTNFPVEVICNGYKFNIDSSFNVSYVGIANKTIITYTTEPEGYTNQDSVKVSVKITNPKGIKSILKPGETDKILPQNRAEAGIDFTVTKNGHYILKVEDMDGNEVSKDIYIDNIDRLAPEISNIAVEAINDGFKIIVNAKDAEATEKDSKSGIKKYEYYIKEASSNGNYTRIESNDGEKEILELGFGKKYSIYVRVYDKANNYKDSEIVEKTTLTKPAPAIGKITFNENNATVEALDYPTLTLDGIMNCEIVPNVGENVKMEITSLTSENFSYYYSLDGGTTWKLYSEPIETQYAGRDKIKTKAVYNKDTSIESEIYTIKKYKRDLTYTCTASDALSKEAYDDDFNTYDLRVLQDGRNVGSINIDPECWGKYFNVYSYSNSNYGFISIGQRGGAWNNPLAGFLAELTGISGKKLCTRSVIIPENSDSIDLVAGTYDATFYVYEVWYGNENLSGNVYSNDNRP